MTTLTWYLMIAAMHTCRTPKTNNFLHVGQCTVAGLNATTIIYLDNYPDISNQCYPGAVPNEVVALDVSWSFSVIISEFCPAIKYPSNVITRLFSFPNDYDFNPCAYDSVRNQFPVSGELPVHNYLNNNHIFHVSMCTNTTDYSYYTRLLVNNDVNSLSLCPAPLVELLPMRRSYRTDWQEIAACPSCQNGGECKNNSACSCPSGWSGDDCTIPTCSPPCTYSEVCAANNTCFSVLAPSFSQATFVFKSGTPFMQDTFYSNYAPFPGPRYGASLCGFTVTLYLYGGYAADVTNEKPTVMLSDLWAYDIDANTWTWIKGAYTSPPVYPIAVGTTSPAATPGSRAYAITWMSSVIEFFLFGGEAGTGFNNELWKYSIITDSWMWLGGSTDINVPIPPSYPPSISNAATFTLPSGGLWIYGGDSTSALSSGPTADLWSYEPSSNIWTHHTSASPNPGPLYKGQIWLSGNYIYYFGGASDLVQPENSPPRMFQLQYTSDITWQQMARNSSVSPLYPGALGGTCADCNPGVRAGAVTWVVSDTLLFLFGGATSATGGLVQRYNDVWMIDVANASLPWYWVSGDKGPIAGLAPSDPQPLVSPAYSFVDYNQTGFLYIFGGLDPSHAIQDSTFEFEMTTKHWYKKTNTSMSSVNVQYPSFPSFPAPYSLPHPGNLVSAVLLPSGTGSHLNILGGFHSIASTPYVPAKGVWDYDTQANLFSYTQDVDGSLLSYGATIWKCNGVFYFFGGTGQNRANLVLTSYFYITNNYDPVLLGGGVLTMANYDNSSGPIWPGARAFSFGWVNGTTLWMFGGTGFIDDPKQILLDEVWAYETTTTTWRLVSGTKILSAPETSGSPGSRVNGQAAANGTHMWYFGGVGVLGQEEVVLFSLWQYSILTNEWKCLSNTSDNYGKFPAYAGQGSTPDFLYPPTRANGGAMYLNNSFYIFGGAGLLSGAILWADLWEFDLERSMWFFIGGSKQPNFTISSYNPRYGSGIPTSRQLFSFLGTSTGMWVYGGHFPNTNMELSDMWFIQINKNERVIPDPCLSGNGGCDYSRTCQNYAGVALCGPCPLGTHLNGSICTSDCGDNYCNSSIGENCVSCPFDCKSAACEICGDNVCSESEKCTTCFDDCGPCVVPQCNCNKHGTCDRNGQCSCSVGWAGPSCNEKNQPITVSINSTSPGLNLGTSGNTSFTISIRTIAEVYQGTTFHSENIEDLHFTLVEVETGNKNKIHNYSTIMENGASLNITLWQFVETATTLNVAGVATTFQANTVKLSVRVGNWRFNSQLNSLFITFDTGSPESTCINSQENSNSSVQWFMVNVGDVSLYGQLIDQAELDGRTRTISFSLNESAVTAILPHFWEYADMDPHFSVLLGDTNKGKCGQNKNTGVNKKLVEIVVPIVVFFAILLVLFIIFASRLKSRLIIWKSKDIDTSTSMDELNAKSEKSPEIEHRRSMEANTTAGRFHFRL